MIETRFFSKMQELQIEGVDIAPPSASLACNGHAAAGHGRLTNPQLFCAPRSQALLPSTRTGSRGRCMSIEAHSARRQPSTTFTAS